MKIRFSPLSLTNDPYEYKKRTIGLTFPGDMSNEDLVRALQMADEFNKDGVKVGCFVAESQDNWKEGKGIRKSRMWAQYGNNQSGIAFVFDQKLLLEECKNHVTSQWAIAKKRVKYHSVITNYIPNPCWADLKENFKNSDSGFLEKILFQNAKSYWYTKHKDWKDENEYRIMMFTKNPQFEYINIAPSLEAIVLGDKVVRTMSAMMSKYFNDKKFDIYQLFYKSSCGDYELNEIRV